MFADVCVRGKSANSAVESAEKKLKKFYA